MPLLMRSILGYIKSYISTINWLVFAPSLFLISFLIYLNYNHQLHGIIRSYNEERQFVSWYFIFLGVLFFPYGLQAIFEKKKLFYNWRFVLLLVLGPAVFAWKMVYTIGLTIADDIFTNAYWNAVLYWPLKLVVVTFILLVLWWLFDRKNQPFYGLSSKHFKARPYWIMLLIMVPLVAAASTQPDFLAMYPKLKNISYLNGGGSWYHKLLFELSYGSDFFTIELFFRGFLILAFAKWAGKDAILPMALFYCTIHFGKPIGECISSFFGGLLLGMVTLHTRSIWGGLMVHVGIAWLMELGGYLGNAVRGL